MPKTAKTDPQRYSLPAQHAAVYNFYAKKSLLEQHTKGKVNAYFDSGRIEHTVVSVDSRTVPGYTVIEDLQTALLTANSQIYSLSTYKDQKNREFVVPHNCIHVFNNQTYRSENDLNSRDHISSILKDKSYERNSGRSIRIDIALGENSLLLKEGAYFHHGVQHLDPNSQVVVTLWPSVFHTEATWTPAELKEYGEREVNRLRLSGKYDPEIHWGQLSRFVKDPILQVRPLYKSLSAGTPCSTNKYKFNAFLTIEGTLLEGIDFKAKDPWSFEHLYNKRQ
jgi:hypothetical protein